MKPEYKILIIAFLLRAIPFVYVANFNPNGVLLFDSYNYLQIADNLINHNIFSASGEGYQLIHDIRRTPTFPIFIVGLKKISNKLIWIASIILLIGSINVLLVYKICNLIFNQQKLKYLATFLVAIDIPSIYFSGVIMTESVFTFLLLISIYLFIIALKNEKIILFILSGLILSVAILCRPIAILLPIIFSIFLFFKTKKIKPVVLFFVSSFFLVYGWMNRNKEYFNTYQLSSISSINLYFHTSASILSEAENISTEKAQLKLREKFNASHKWNGDERDIVPMINYFQNESIKMIINHPSIFIKQYLIGSVYFYVKPIRNYIDSYFGINAKEYSKVAEKSIQNNLLNKLFNETSLLTLILVIIQLIFSAILILGIILSFKQIISNSIYILFLLIIIYFTLTSSITEVDGRFRLPALPFLAILSSISICKILPITDKKVN